MTKVDKVVELFATKDMQLASLLYATGSVLDSVYRENDVFIFTFCDRPKCEKIESQHLQGQLKLSTKTLFAAIYTIKSIIRGKR